MAYIDTIIPEEAEGTLKKEYEKALKRSGRISNIRKVMSKSPEAMRDSMRMYLSIMYGKSELSRAQREMLATVVSSTNQCHY
ncbi:MAG: carboxymuconolactone decarboxylase family protein [Fidelibacterota bacterium]